MQKENSKYVIKLNTVSRNLLLSSLGTCKFALLHVEHPFAGIISENDLVDENHLLHLFQQIKTGKDDSTLELSLPDEILIYTALDITCKFFLTELADDLEQKNQDLIAATDAKFSDVRNTLLRSAQYVRDGMRESLKENKIFTERVYLLDSLLQVE